MTPPPVNSPCEVLQELQTELERLALALKKANDILILPAESPDTLRRRRNSIKRWNEVYAIAYERVQSHRREHNCCHSSID